VKICGNDDDFVVVAARATFVYIFAYLYMYMYTNIYNYMYVHITSHELRKMMSILSSGQRNAPTSTELDNDLAYMMQELDQDGDGCITCVVLQCVAVCCSVLQCAIVCCSESQVRNTWRI